jgi:hypothetical protein
MGAAGGLDLYFTRAAPADAGTGLRAAPSAQGILPPYVGVIDRTRGQAATDDALSGELLPDASATSAEEDSLPAEDRTAPAVGRVPAAVGVLLPLAGDGPLLSRPDFAAQAGQDQPPAGPVEGGSVGPEGVADDGVPTDAG